MPLTDDELRRELEARGIDVSNLPGGPRFGPASASPPTPADQPQQPRRAPRRRAGGESVMPGGKTETPPDAPEDAAPPDEPAGDVPLAAVRRVLLGQPRPASLEDAWERISAEVKGG